MMSSEPCCAKDKYGFDTLYIEMENLEDFPALIQLIRDKGYGRDTGLLKLRLHGKDRQDSKCVQDIIAMLNKKLKETTHDPVTKTTNFAYNPDAQLFFRASVKDHIYQFSKAECSVVERRRFVKDATNPMSYMPQINCCTQVLESDGVEGARRHCFEQVQGSAPFISALLEKERKHQKLFQLPCRPENIVQSPVIYGAGINVESQVKICGNFSLCSLGTIIDDLDEKYDGLATPYIYCGAAHSIFPWHIEDGGLFSINYLFGGAPKIWFGMAPDDFGLVDAIAQSLKVDLAHSSCRALLLDHKTLVADPQYFKNYHGVPYSILVQEPGDFVITLPFALHSGMNLGTNLAMASNFGDLQWIEDGIYAPICDCYENQIHIDFTKLLELHRPDLLQSYLDASGLFFPSSHPREVRRHTVNPSAQNVPSPSFGVRKDCSASHVSVPKVQKKSEKRTLFCPECNQTFTDSKKKRLQCHIRNQHAEKEQDLIRVVNTLYPPWAPKTSAGNSCKVCGAFRRGSITHLKKHHEKEHSHLPFDGPLKK